MQNEIKLSLRGLIVGLFLALILLTIIGIKTTSNTRTIAYMETQIENLEQIVKENQLPQD